MSKNADKITNSLEERIAYLEYYLDNLSNELYSLRQDYEKQKVLIKYLSEKLKSANLSNVAPRSEETPPPHY
ncbi:MAG: SlyX family protein [Succinivibrionaceae bacterium]|nr:SlyX family protein [Ruminobacter sp.]MDY5780228.1 SlyX family protein [Succinivibrionaceae bacterium]MEE1339746.1 SlyX family protein [Succinivibrionaceae bacterium]